MRNYSSSLPYILSISYILPSISLSVIGLDVPQVFFKVGGVLLLLLALLILLFTGRKIEKNSLFLVFLISGFFFIFFISELFAFSIGGMIVAFFRFASILLFCLVIFMLEKDEIKKTLNKSFKLLITISIIGVLLFIFRYNGGEKIPFFNLYSNKSILFEQNVYGISVYMLFIYILNDHKNMVFSVISFAAIFSSFYRTVYLLVLLRVAIYNAYTAVLLALDIILIAVLYMDEIYSILRLDQVATLTGRDVLWSIGIDGFLESPIIGLGESSIPIFSNVFLNRDPAFTTYHNVVIDVLYINGLVGCVYLIVLFFVYYRLIGKNNFIYGSFLIAPAMLNTFYPFSFNVLGGFLGMILVYHYRHKKSMKNDR